MTKKLMILGAGRGQVGLYRAAHKLGYETIAVSIDGDWPGFALADRICYVNLYDVEGIAQLAEDIGADGITTACLEIGLPALGRACDRNHLPGFSYETARISTDKALMKEALEKAGVRTARFRRVSSGKELEEVAAALHFPLITKAVDLSGTRGIHIAFDRADLAECYRQTMEATGKDYCVVEEYLDGYECSATAFIAGGEITFVLPTGDIRYGENDEVPIGHYLPYEDRPEILAQIDTEVRKAIYAIGLDDCAVNVDLMIYQDQVYVLELTGRMGANCMPELTSVYYGFDIHELIVRTAVGDYSMAQSLRTDHIQGTPCRGQMIMSEVSGVIKRLDTEAAHLPQVEQVWMFAGVGSAIRKFTNPKDCIGQIVVRGRDEADCIRAVKEAVDRIHIELEETGAVSG